MVICMTDQEKEKAYLHWLYRSAGTGSRHMLKDMGQIGGAQEIYRLLRAGKLEQKLSGRYQKKIAQMEAFSESCDVEAEYDKMCGRGISVVFWQEEAYPQKLKSIPDAPFALYYVGKLPSQGAKSAAVIGSRNCSEYGRYMANQVGMELAEAGVQVVSGMARGIDGISQSAALLQGGYSVGVLGCGVDICYPKENEALYHELIKKGAVCSEYPPGTPPRSILFPPRNRIISGLADAVLVIEAKEKSGTLITVDMALEQGRDVYALPGRATDPLSAGCNRLIRQGAGIVVSVQEFVRDLAGAYEPQEHFRQQTLSLPEGVQGELLQMLDFSPQSAETIWNRYNGQPERKLALPDIFHELLNLCALGYAKQIGGSYFVKCM